MANSENRIEVLLVEILSSHQTLLKEVSALRELVAGELELRHMQRDKTKRTRELVSQVLDDHFHDKNSWRPKSA